MSALAIILAAGMVVGNGPEKASGEITSGLDLGGTWEGSFEDIAPTLTGDFEARRITISKACFDKDEFRLECDSFKATFLYKFVDDGAGKFHINAYTTGKTSLGIYQQDGDRLIICWSHFGQNRPTSFHASKGQLLFALHRVKPRK